MGISCSGGQIDQPVEKKEKRVILVGLDASGKTAILNHLKKEETANLSPTIGLNVEKIDLKTQGISSEVVMWEFSGQDKMRQLWVQFYDGTDAIIFVVDSTDSARIGEAGEELLKLVSNFQLSSAVLLILANKTDLPDAMSVEEVTRRLGYLPYTQGRKVHIEGTSASTGAGIREGLSWLGKELAAKR